MKLFTLLSISLFISNSLSSKELPVGKAKKDNPSKRVMALCAVPTAKIDLDVNNVKASIMASADMWWDQLGSSKYEIPKGSGKHSLFASSIWIGGFDEANNLSVAAQTYRQFNSVDFWNGPLDTAYASITPEECLKYDRHWKISKAEVQNFINTSVATEAILSYPGNGDMFQGQSQFLAPFFDNNGDGIYNYLDGDYPNYNLSGVASNCSNILMGDQTIWWVFNDKGGVHTASGSNPLGLEIQAQAFAYSDTGHIGNATFYKYKIINRSTQTLSKVYFGQWVDADLGAYPDDYVGCDVGRGLGYCYNGDNNDEGAAGYGLNPPAVGIDFFQGPIADSGDGIDNDRDGITDEYGEEIIMSKFVYFNNDNTAMGNPNQASHFYNYLSGKWRDGTPMTYGGNGKGSGVGATSIPCNFMFPGDTDPISTVPWSETTAGNLIGDRRFVISAGSFTLLPGAVNYITIGAVWARDLVSSDRSLTKLKEADDAAQYLFNNCFNELSLPAIPVADFSADTLLIYEGDTVTFTNNTQNYNIPSWYFPGGVVVNSAIIKKVVYNTEGTYTVSLIASNVSGQDSISKESYVTVLKTVGINNISINNLKVYPVPFSSYTLISFENKNYKKHSIQIFDISGKRVVHYENINTDKLKIERGNLKAGIYFMKLTRLEDNASINRKLIIE